MVSLLCDSSHYYALRTLNLEYNLFQVILIRSERCLKLIQYYRKKANCLTCIPALQEKADVAIVVSTRLTGMFNSSKSPSDTRETVCAHKENQHKTSMDLHMQPLIVLMYLQKEKKKKKEEYFLFYHVWGSVTFLLLRTNSMTESTRTAI